jgi:hypothetical protein
MTSVWKKRRTLRLIAVACVAAGGGFAGAAIAAQSRGHEASSAVRFFPAPDGYVLASAAWLPSAHRVVVTAIPDSTVGFQSSRLLATAPGSREWQRLSVPAERNCASTSQSFPEPLPDGRLAFLQHCWGNAERLPDRAVSLRAYDFATGGTSRLVPYYLPFTTSGFSFGRTVRSGILNNGLGLEERLFWIRPRRLVRLRIPLLRAGLPSWSRRTNRIVFDGVPRQPVPDVLARADLARDVYVLDPRTGRLRELVRGALMAGPASWSPDGRSVAMALQPRRAPEGLYLVDVATGRTHLLVRGAAYGATAWISDSEVVATVGGRLTPPAKRGLVVVRIKPSQL